MQGVLGAVFACSVALAPRLAAKGPLRMVTVVAGGVGTGLGEATGLGDGTGLGIGEGRGLRVGVGTIGLGMGLGVTFGLVLGVATTICSCGLGEFVAAVLSPQAVTSPNSRSVAPTLIWRALANTSAS